MITFMVDTTKLACTLEADEVAKTFFKEIKNRNSEQREALGILHMKVMEVFIKQLLTDLALLNSNGKPQEQTEKLVTEWLEYVEAYTAKVIAHLEIQTWKIMKAYHKQHRKLAIQVSSGTKSWSLMTEAVFPWLEKAGARRLIGPPPKGDLERRLQDMVGHTTSVAHHVQAFGQ